MFLFFILLFFILQSFEFFSFLLQILFIACAFDYTFLHVLSFLVDFTNLLSMVYPEQFERVCNNPSLELVIKVGIVGKTRSEVNFNQPRLRFLININVKP